MGKAKTEKSKVLTIGHSTRTGEVFLELLRAHGVKRIIDVRSIPRSGHNPHPIQPGDTFRKASCCEDRLRAFAASRRTASCTL